MRPPTARPRDVPHAHDQLAALAIPTPAIALSTAARETLRVSDIVLCMLQGSLEALRKPGPATRSNVSMLDDDVDALNQAIKLYLTRLDQTELDEDDAKRSAEIMGFAINLEHVGDIIEGGLASVACPILENKGELDESRLRPNLVLAPKTASE